MTIYNQTIIGFSWSAPSVVVVTGTPYANGAIGLSVSLRDPERSCSGYAEVNLQFAKELADALYAAIEDEKKRKPELPK